LRWTGERPSKNFEQLSVNGWTAIVHSINIIIQTEKEKERENKRDGKNFQLIDHHRTAKEK